MSDTLSTGTDGPEDLIEYGPSPDLGAVLESLYSTIHDRSVHRPVDSYTVKLLEDHEDKLLKKIGEEATEVVMAAKSNDPDQIRYESADLLYHLLVVLHRWNVTPQELAAELRSRFK